MRDNSFGLIMLRGHKYLSIIALASATGTIIKMLMEDIENGKINNV